MSDLTGGGAAIHEAVAPLLAELAEYELNIEDLNTKTIREIRRLGRDLAEAIRERDEAREDAADLRDYVKAVHAELAEAKAGRDEVVGDDGSGT